MITNSSLLETVSLHPVRLENIMVTLVRPEEAGNVGAVCRAMKNCGLSRLRLVGAGTLHEGTIRARAVHAEDIWDCAEHFESLADAVGDCSLVVGTTRRRGQKRKAVSMPPDVLAAFLKNRASGDCTLVFGNERTGLLDAELRLCSLASHIPVSDAFPSYNLSHAVQIYAYEFFKTLSNPNPVEGQWTPLDSASYATLAHSVTDALERIGFYKQRGREEQELFFRDVFSRAGLSEREGRYMAGIFEKASRLALLKTDKAPSSAPSEF